MDAQHTQARALMRSMMSRAAHVTWPRGESLVTELVGGICVQVVGRPTYRNTLDGRQPTVSFHWSLECRRSSKAKVFAAITKATGAAA